MNSWEVIYASAENHPADGGLYFPERLTQGFLDQQKRVLGSYFYANQYLNEVVPDDERRFKKEWLRYCREIPQNGLRFGFIDPAIGQKDSSDYTGIVVVDTVPDGTWYLRVAVRERLTPTQIVEKMFSLCETFNLQALGVEAVAYQEALLYMLDEEMRRRGKVLPVWGIKRSNVTKETRILGLVPRFEWSRLYLMPGMTDFETEYMTFPRGAHDDIFDALASVEELIRYPEVAKAKELKKPHSPHDPSHEKYIIQQLVKKSNENQGEEE